MPRQPASSRRHDREGDDHGIRARTPRLRSGTTRAGRWELVLEFPRSPDQPGQRQRRSWTFHGSQANAWKRLGELEHQARRGELAIRSRLTVGDVFARYLAEHVRHHLAPLTYQAYEEAYRLRCASISELRLDKLQRHHLTALEDHLRTHGHTRTHGPLSEAKVAQTCSAVKSALTWAEEVDLLAGKNPARFWHVGSAVSAERPSLSRSDARAFLVALEQSPARLPLLTLLTTNLRISELRGLRWRDVDLDGGTYEVRQQVQRVYVAPTAGQARGVARLQVRPLPKSQAGRRGGGLADEVIGLLRSWRVEQQAQRLRAGAVWRHAERAFGELVFTRETGQPLVAGTLRLELLRVLAAADLPALSFHSLRHSWVSLALESGVAPHEVSRLAGHASQATTQQVYVHVDRAAGKRAADRLMDYLRGAG